MRSPGPPSFDVNTATDSALATRIAAQARGVAGPEEAELCRRFAPRIRHYGLRHLRNDQAAADLVQRVLLLTLEKLRAGAVREPERIASFVLGTARYVTQAMRRSREQTMDIDAEALERAASSGASPSSSAAPRSGPAILDQTWSYEAAHDTLDAERLAHCMETLNERERTVTVLTYYHEQSAAEIATALSLQEGNVRVVRHRAIERLRRCLGWQEGQV